MTYEIIVEEILSDRFATYFEPLIISNDGQHTIITGQLVDHAALFGIIGTIRDLNLKLVSINRLEYSRLE